MPYTAEMEPQWNAAIERSRNGTFLLDRRFMDYHQERFHDCSLMFLKRDKVLGCFPANYDTESHTVYSHQGLTYGGLLLHDETSTSQVLYMFDLLRSHYKQELGADKLVYKAIPSIYHRYPSEEDRYALFRNGASLTARGMTGMRGMDTRCGYVPTMRSGWMAPLGSSVS